MAIRAADGVNEGSEAPAFADVGDVEAFPSGTMTIVTAGEHQVGIYNLDGELIAIRNSCPHRGAPVCKGTVTGAMLPSAPGSYRWGMEGTVIRCPWHGWEFDLRSGSTLFGTDRRRLIRYEVAVHDGRVFLQLKRPRESVEA
jgi:nitrite reductase/ring-hydroxylating ferredoxin subunit